MLRKLFTSYVAICSIFRNEHTMLREWVTYHRWLGVSKFYLFDHASMPPLINSIQDMMNDNVVEYHYFKQNMPEDSKQGTLDNFSPQAWAYQQCFRWFGHRHQFMIFIDADEFIVLNDNNQLKQPNITQFLEPFAQYGGLKVYWRMFGSSNLNQTRKDKGALASYVNYVPKDAMEKIDGFKHNPFGYMKSIVNMNYMLGPCNPHSCSLRSKSPPYVNEKEQAIPNTTTPGLEKTVLWDRIEIYHYKLQSEEEYRNKMRRGSGHTFYVTGGKSLGKSWSHFKHVNAMASAVETRGPELWDQCCRGLNLTV